MAKDYLRYARKYGFTLFNRDFSLLQGFSEHKRVHVLKALSGLAKFCGVYEDFQRLVRNYGLRWSGGKSEDLLLSRIANADRNGEVLEWVKRVKAKIPGLSVFVDFMVLSGLRLVEAVESYNLIIDLAENGKLSEYYNFENEALEHFRFKKRFIRRTKKAFVSFIPKWLIDRISKSERLTLYQVKQRVGRDRTLKARFSDIREFYATFMTKWLNQAEIDFLQGRISGSVFMRNYFNPALIGDLKERVFKGLGEIQSKL